MPLFKTDALRNSLRRREIAQVYVMFGPETYLRDIAIKTICDRSFEEGELRDFNECEFSLNTEGNLATALASAEQLPMMSKRRVVRINDVRISPVAARDTLREDDEAALKAYLSRPADFSVVLFVADEFDKRRKMAKVLIESAAVVVEFCELTEPELMKWARDKIRDAGSEIDERALRLLASQTGPDVRRLTVEI